MDADWPIPIIDPERCDGCGLCVKACPNGVLAVETTTKGNLVAVVTQPKACQYTGHCVSICPQQAITLRYEITLPDGSNEAS